MRKFAFLMAVGLFLLNIAPAKTSAAAAADATFDLTKVQDGVIGVHYRSSDDHKLKVLIEANSQRYVYDLNAADNQELFPLQMGNGQYTVQVMENTSGNKYRAVEKETVNVNLQNQNEVFLNTTQIVNWNDSMTAIKKADELTKGKKTDEEKVKAIYDYIISTIKYDTQLAKTVQSGYVPNIEQVLTDRKGICYGYSALFAAMLRSEGIPTKLDMGTSTFVDVYHAWNEVFINGKWEVIDTTVDASLKASKKSFEMVKNTKDYKVALVY
ncbi:transglutaminase domain-containing protein [Gorillibacterium massiliense]|uniref:transglutaminase domain-containing protein n=1 Tax=Gorillibacterium massiliense TaxID=1280390 RepID=UPI0005939B04|nr:transglutaminase-like domain-containing protein [Gorillibacterium massiliense]